ncbi:hypothetical protein Tco_0416587, partial [Tanacetum coccineum]
HPVISGVAGPAPLTPAPPAPVPPAPSPPAPAPQAPAPPAQEPPAPAPPAPAPPVPSEVEFFDFFLGRSVSSSSDGSFGTAPIQTISK